MTDIWVCSVLCETRTLQYNYARWICA